MPPVTDMRSYIERLDEMGEIKRIEGAELDTEVGALTEHMGDIESQALLFDGFAGFPKGFRIISNLFRTCSRSAVAMGLPTDVKGVDFLHAWRKRSLEFQPMPYEQVEGGPVFDNQMEEDEVDLTRFPTPIVARPRRRPLHRHRAAASSPRTRSPAASISAPTG